MKQPGTIGQAIRRTPRAAAGGSLLLLALLLLLFFKFGPGGAGQAEVGTGESGGNAENLLVNARPNASETSRPEPTDADNISLSVDEQQALAGNVLEVLIDEHDYLVAVASDPEPVYRPMSVDQITRLAGLAAGDSNGIRVRVVRRDTARAQAEESLKKALEAVGITANMIHMSESMVP